MFDKRAIAQFKATLRGAVIEPLSFGMHKPANSVSLLTGTLITAVLLFPLMELT